MDIFAQIFFVVLRQVFHNLSSTAIGQYTAARYSTMPHLSELQPEKSISAIYKNSFSSCHAPILVSCTKPLSVSVPNQPDCFIGSHYFIHGVISPYPKYSYRSLYTISGNQSSSISGSPKRFIGLMCQLYSLMRLLILLASMLLLH